MRLQLSFDDGPAPATETILDLLAEAGTRASFFVIGERVVERPELARRIVEEGHEIGNHTMRHPRLTELEPQQAREELIACSDEIERAVGLRPRRWRPPYAACSPAVDRAAADAGLAERVMWDIDPRDWDGGSAAEIAAAVETDAERLGKPDPIVLLHDGYDQPAATIAAVARLLGPAR